jgi:hypothetical protein
VDTLSYLVSLKLFLIFIFVDQVDLELGIYLSKNESKHIYRETAEEQLAARVRKITNAKASQDPIEVQKIIEEMKLEISGTRLAPLFKAPHAFDFLEALLRRGTYFRQVQIFSRKWMDENMLSSYGAVSVKLHSEIVLSLNYITKSVSQLHASSLFGQCRLCVPSIATPHC